MSVGGPLYLSIDVGTTSARAAIFDGDGRRIRHGLVGFSTWNEEGEMYEQSSEEIWQAVCAASKVACGDDGGRVKGIGFDATCSLVVLGSDNEPLSVSLTGEAERNIVLWMDHRATAEADTISNSKDEAVRNVLQHYGNKISPENEIPKLLWLKKHLPDTWKRAAKFFDLADFLSFRATGDEARGVCATACKWGRVDRHGWSREFFNRVGLGDLCEDDFSRIGRRVLMPGEALEAVVSPEAAVQLGGLSCTVKVASALVDAHAGGVGMLGAAGHPKLDRIPIEQRLAVISGTSTCHLVVSKEAVFVPGVWGPFQDALGPGMWLTEGGQSATGALLDHVIESHARAKDVEELASKSCTSRYAVLEEIALRVGQEATWDVHVLPYFHGNRHPRADPSLRGMISGLRLGRSIEDLAVLYMATLEAIIYGARHLIEALNKAGHQIQVILLCGGGAKSETFIKTLADGTGLSVILSSEPEAVLLGNAVNAATACGACGGNIRKVMEHMGRVSCCVDPDVSRKSYHDAKYQVFLRMYGDFLAYREIMKKAM